MYFLQRFLLIKKNRKIFLSPVLALGLNLLWGRKAVPAPIIDNLTLQDRLTIELIVQNQSKIEQGNRLYEAGQFSEAVTIWQEAVMALSAEGDILNQAMVTSNISSAYQEMGEWEKASEAIASSLELLQTHANTEEKLPIFAQVLNTQGNLQLARSQPEAALNTFKEAEEIYTNINDEVGIIRSQINQAKALQALGLYRRALDILTQLNPTLQQQPDSPLKAAGLRSFGNILRVVGDLEESRQILQQSLAVAEQINSPQNAAAALFGLGNTAVAQQDREAAFQFYQLSGIVSPSPTLKLQAQLNQLNLLVKSGQNTAVMELLPEIESGVANLPPSRIAVYGRIDLVRSLMGAPRSGSLRDRRGAIVETRHALSLLLAEAIKQAQSLGEKRGESYAVGQLGLLYLQTQQWSDAGKLTEEALLIAQGINAPDIAYLWQWQLGRIFAATGDRQKAIAAYTEAVNTLESIRSDLVAINPEIQFEFRESVEPVYRELVDLLLQPTTTDKNPVKPTSSKPVRQLNLYS